MSLIQRPDVRLLTLTGPGGIGKTRLAIEVAHEIDDQTTWSTYFVSLASVGRVQDAIPAIAEAMDVWNPQDADPVGRTVRAIQGNQTLLVVDNLEHIIDVAPEISELVAACPTLKVLATSREPLRVEGEREYAVSQLTVPDPSDTQSLNELLANESIALFVDRARAVSQRFSVDESNADAVTEICARLDGLPLAIELAAARVKTLPPATLLARLDSQLQILRSETRDLPSRLQTMRAAIDWSYGLLTPEDQRTFRRLSIFVGEFPLGGASAVLQRPDIESIDAIAALVDRSLIASRDPLDDEPYFRMLVVVREFGQEQLEAAGELDEARRLHAEYIARVAEQIYGDQFGENQGQVFDYLDRLHENIRLAMSWTIESENWGLAIRIGAHLWQYWDVRGHLAEGRRWLAQLLDKVQPETERSVPRLFYGYAILAGSSADAEANVDVAQRLLEFGETNGNRAAIATAKMIFGLGRSPDITIPAAVEATTLWEQLGDSLWAGMSAGLASRWLRETGDLDPAEEYARMSYDLLKESGHLWGFGLALLGLGRVHQLKGHTDEAVSYLKQGLHLMIGINDRIVVFRFIEYLFEVAADYRQYAQAVRLAGSSQRMREVIGYGLRYPAEEAAVNRILNEARSAIGDETFDREWAAGERLSLDEAIAEALVIQPERVASTAPAEAGGIRLTRREREVLQLVVQGKTDQEIADELYVSYRTVTTHVTNILNKLGANSRTEAAAIAVRDGLV